MVKFAPAGSNSAIILSAIATVLALGGAAGLWVGAAKTGAVVGFGILGMMLTILGLALGVLLGYNIYTRVKAPKALN